ncbi:glycosyltransferase family 25 protein, partial [Alcanivorax sp. 1008]|uniref:glycosyltransferase family 25 protein n=1 Tax=Alcanivorax sp. 1008 TaxID=2816853 RepID=UPI001DD3931C
RRFMPGYLGNGVPVLLISLEDQSGRRQDLISRGIPESWVHSFFPAVDLRDALEQDIAPIADLVAFEEKFSRRMRAAEVGCAMSHNAVAAWLVSSPFSIGLVLEDDVIPRTPDWLDQVATIADALSPHAQSGAAFICHLGAPSNQVGPALKRRVTWRDGRPPTDMPQIFLHADPASGLWRAHAYLISRAAAERSSTQETPIMTLADDWCERRRRGWLDEIFFTQSALIGQDEDRPSTIRPSDHNDCIKTKTGQDSFLARVGRSLANRNFLKSLYGSLRFRAAMALARFFAKRDYRVSLTVLHK